MHGNTTAGHWYAVCSSSSLSFCGLIQGKVGQTLSTINECFRRFCDRHETLSNAFTDSVGTICRSWVTQNRLSCARLLCKHHQQINNTRNVDISPELGVVAVPEVPCAIRPVVCPCAEFRLMRAAWHFEHQRMHARAQRHLPRPTAPS